MPCGVLDLQVVALARFAFTSSKDRQSRDAANDRSCAPPFLVGPNSLGIRSTLIFIVVLRDLVATSPATRSAPAASTTKASAAGAPGPLRVLKILALCRTALSILKFLVQTLRLRTIGLRSRIRTGTRGGLCP